MKSVPLGLAHTFSCVRFGVEEDRTLRGRALRQHLRGAGGCIVPECEEEGKGVVGLGDRNNVSNKG